MEGNEKEWEDTEQNGETLASKLDDKMVVSLDEVNWEEASKELEWAVMLKCASGRPIRKGMTVDVFQRIWKLRKNAESYKVEKNILLVKLWSREDQLKVLDGGPWMVEGEAILLQKWEVGMTGDDFVNTHINIWIHMYGLPYELRRQDFADGFAKYAGNVLKWSAKKRDVMYEGEYISSRISLDTTQPILPGFFLERIGRKPVWIGMKYERLPNVCYKCGKMTHDTRICKVTGLNLERNFGGWLRADDPVRFKPEWSDELTVMHHGSAKGGEHLVVHADENYRGFAKGGEHSRKDTTEEE